MGIFQGLAQEAAGSKFEDIVAGIALQMQNAIKGSASVTIGSGTWDSMVVTFNSVLKTYQTSF